MLSTKCIIWQMSCEEESTGFEAVCFAKYQEFSWDFFIDVFKNSLNCTEMAYINNITKHINYQILFAAIPMA